MNYDIVEDEYDLSLLNSFVTVIMFSKHVGQSFLKLLYIIIILHLNDLEFILMLCTIILCLNLIVFSGMIYDRSGNNEQLLVSDVGVLPSGIS